MTLRESWRREFTRRDDAVHFNPDPRWWELWYVDAEFDNGYWLAGIFSFGSPRAPANSDIRLIEIAFYNPEGERRMVRVRYPKEESSASETTCKVIIGPNIFEGEIPTYHLFLSEKGMGCDLIFQSEVEGLLDAEIKAMRGVLEQIPVARAKVSGTLTWDNKTMRVEGLGRHEHNLSLPPDFPPLMSSSIEYLVWTNIWLPNWTLIVIAGRETRKEGHQRFGDIIAFKKDKILNISHKGHMNRGRYVIDQRSIDYPQSFLAVWDDSELVTGEIKMEVKKVIEFFDLHTRFKPFERCFSKTYIGSPTYHRLIYDYNIDLKISGEPVTSKGSAWCEYHKNV